VSVFLWDVPAATAILDRFLAHAVIVQMTGKSHRLRQRTGRRLERMPAWDATQRRPALRPGRFGGFFNAWANGAAWR
jgi:hypothetical protein